MSSKPGSNSAGTASVVCRYYVNGCCSLGDRCTFLHDRSARPDMMCRFYLKGSCNYGAVCRYDHVRPKRSDNNQKSTTTTKSSLPKPVQLSKPGLNTNAAEFVPTWKRAEPGGSYSAAAGGSTGVDTNGFLLPLCPYFEMGECENENCTFVHGIVCDLCSKACLHPDDPEQQLRHRSECTVNHQIAMESAFAEARSVDKTCGICMENIVEKGLRFGILEGCQHCFCLDCVREWRKNQCKSVLDEVARSCPECRQHSDYVVPSSFWVEDVTEKALLIDIYKENTQQKLCKYYQNGRMREGCPFGNKCFYKHQLPDGSIDPGENPHVRRKAQLAEFIFGTDDEDATPDEDLSTLDSFMVALSQFRQSFS